MVHSALKLKTFTEKYGSSSVPRESSRETVFSLPETTSSSSVLRSTPPVRSSPMHPPPPVIRILLEMMTPNECATILRSRVARLVSQWSQYTSQPPTLLHHGLPSPSSSGSPQVQQQNQTGKKTDLTTIHSFVAFFYPEEHQIHQSGDLSPETLLAHLEGLQTLLSFLSSKELRVIIRNRVVSSSSHRSASIQAVVEVIRNMSAEDEENEDLESTWKQLWLNTTPIPSAPTNPSNSAKTFVDVAVATKPSSDVLPTAMTMGSVANIPSMRPSPSDGSRPSKRPKYIASHSMFQDSIDDFHAGLSLPPFNPLMNDTTHDHSHVSGSTSTITMSIPMSKMADPILRPVSTRSFKSPPITSALATLDDDGEADAEGDTDTDIDMDVDLAVDNNERGDDSKDLTIAQVINSCRSEEAATNTLTTSHSLSKVPVGPRLGTPSENSNVSIVTTTSVAAAAPSSTSVNSADTSNVLPSNSRHHGDIPKGPRAMRSLLSNESIYSVSSGSRTPSIPNVNSLSRIPPSNTITTSAAMNPVTTLQAKQGLLSGEWGLTTKNAELKESGTRQFPIEILDQKSDASQQQHVKEHTPRRIGPIPFPTKPSVPSVKRAQEFLYPPSPTQPVFVAPRGPPPPPPPSSTSSSISSILKSTNTTSLRYEGPELPPYDEVALTNVLPKPTPETSTTTTLSVLAPSSRSKPSRRDKKSTISRSRTSSPSKSRSRSADEKRHRLPKKKSSLPTKYETPSSTRHSTKHSHSHSHSHSQSDKRAWDSSSRSSSRSTSRSRSESRSRVPYRPRNYSYSRPPSPSSSKDRHWSPEPSRRRERGRSRSRRRRGDENLSTSRTSNGMDHWSPGRDGRRGDDSSRTDTTTRSSNVKSRSGRV